MTDEESRAFCATGVGGGVKPDCSPTGAVDSTATARGYPARLQKRAPSSPPLLGVQANPKVRLLRDARRDFFQYSKAFGLDPAIISLLSGPVGAYMARRNTM